MPGLEACGYQHLLELLVPGYWWCCCLVGPRLHCLKYHYPATMATIMHTDRGYKQHDSKMNKGVYVSRQLLRYGRICAILSLALLRY